MRIPAFGLGGTQTPYTFVEESTKGQRDAIRAEGAAGVAQANALADVGQTLSYVSKDVRDFTRRIEEQEAVTALQSARSKYHVEAAQAALDWENTIDGPTALSSMSGLKDRLQPIKQKYLDSAPSKIAKERIGLDLDAREADFMVHGEKVARKKFKEHSLAVDEETHNNFKLAARMAGQRGDVNALQGIIDQGNAWLMGSGMVGIAISPSEAELLSPQRGRTYVASFLQGQLDNDRTAMKAIKEFEAGQYNEKLGEKEYDKMKHVVEVRKHQLAAEARRAQAEARQELREKHGQLLRELDSRGAAVISAGQLASDAMDKIQELAAVESKLTGKSSKKTAEFFTEYFKSGMQMHGILQEMKFAPFEEQLIAVEKLKPSDPTDPTYAQKQAVYEKAREKVKSTYEAILHDPAEITTRRVALQIQASGGDPAAQYQDVISGALALQSQMGIPRDKQKIIPVRDAQRIAAEFDMGDEDKKLGILASLENYGPYKNKAMAELKIDPSAQVAAELIGSNSAQSLNAARALVSVNGVKGVNLAEAEEAAYVKDVMKSSKVLSLLEEQGRRLPVGGAERNEFAQSLKKDAAKTAKVLGDAAKAASNIDMAFTAVHDDRLALALVPKHISEEEAVRGFAMLRANISEKDLAEVKAKIVAEKGAGVGERIFQERLRDIRSRGIWIDQRGGFALLDPVTWRPVGVQGSKPFIVTAAQLKEAGRYQYPATESIADDPNIFGGDR